jgi:ketosteroid isomerase-like protein
MLPTLPKPVAAYIEAEKAKDANKLALCFTEDGLVHDEGQNHKGRDAIRQWKQEADSKYQYLLEPLSASVNGDTVQLRARLTGNFPGSPVELDHIFTLAGNHIASLEILS